MNQAFMEEFYEQFYDNPVEAALDRSPKAWELYLKVGDQEQKLKEQLGGMDSSPWKSYEEISELIAKANDLLCKASYLMGAQDRERMLYQ